MHCRTIGLVAAAALSANAFLLPPGTTSLVSKPDLSAIDIDVRSQSLRLHCPECVFSSQEEKTTTEAKDDGNDVFWIQGGSKDVLLNFSITDDRRTMTLNGVPVYPVMLNGQHAQTVDQVASSASLVDIKNKVDAVAITPLRVSAESLFVSVETMPGLDNTLVHFTYQILSLEKQPVSLDAVEVKLLKSADEELLLVSVDAVRKAHSIFEDHPMTPGHQDDQGDHAPVSHPGHGHKSPKGCSMLPAFLCNLKNTIESKLPHKFGGCSGRKGGRKGDHRGPGHAVPGHKGRPEHHHGPPAPLPSGHPERPHHGPGRHGPPPPGQHGHHGPPPHGQHGHHGAHNGHRPAHFFHGLNNGFVAFLVGFMAVVVMGPIVYLLGTLTGRLIGYLWLKLGRGGQRGYASLDQAEESVEAMEKGTSDEDDDDEPLPVYEDAPAYEEKDEKL